MIKMGAKRFKPGDEVMVRDWNAFGEKRPDHWNNFGKMDSFCGKIYTISKLIGNSYYLKGYRWSWHDGDFELPHRLPDDLFEI